MSRRTRCRTVTNDPVAFEAALRSLAENPVCPVSPRPEPPPTKVLAAPSVRRRAERKANSTLRERPLGKEIRLTRQELATKKAMKEERRRAAQAMR